MRQSASLKSKGSIPLSKHRKGDASVSVPEHAISDPSSMMLSTAEKISDVGVSTVDSGKQYGHGSDYRLRQNRGSLRWPSWPAKNDSLSSESNRARLCK